VKLDVMRSWIAKQVNELLGLTYISCLICDNLKAKASMYFRKHVKH
jgi:hypothetical protein